MELFGNGESNKPAFEQELETIKAQYDAFKTEAETREKELEELKTRIKELEEKIANAPKSEETTQAPQQANEDCKCNDTLSQIANAIKELMAQSDEFKMLLARRDTQDANMRAMHKEMEDYKKDFYAKITQPYLVAFLDLHRRFFETYSYFDHLDNSPECNMQELYSNLLREFKNAIIAISDRVYNDFGMEYFEPNVNDEFNPKAHQVMEAIETDDETLYRHVAKVIYGGFRNVDTDKIIRQARIACYKAKQQDNSTENN